MSTSIFNLLVDTRTSNQNLQAAVKVAVTEYIELGHMSLIQTAEAIADNYKQDKKAKNGLLSALRTQMARACDTLEVDRLSVKAIPKTDGMVFEIIQVVKKEKSDIEKALQTAFNEVKKTPNRITLEAFDKATQAYRTELLSKMNDEKIASIHKLETKHDIKIEEVRGFCKVG